MRLKSNSAEFQLICEIMDDFISSDRVRCINCFKIIVDKKLGVICAECYDPMDWLDGDDE